MSFSNDYIHNVALLTYCLIVFMLTNVKWQNWCQPVLLFNLIYNIDTNFSSAYFKKHERNIMVTRLGGL